MSVEAFVIDRSIVEVISANSMVSSIRRRYKRAQKIGKHTFVQRHGPIAPPASGQSALKQKCQVAKVHSVHLSVAKAWQLTSINFQ